MVWNASSTGRMAESTSLLLPIQTPTATAATTTSRVATSVVASVFMLSFHSPVPRITASQASVTAAGRQPPRVKASASSTSAIAHHGDCARSDSSGLTSEAVTASLSPLVNPENVPTVQSVAPETAFASGPPRSGEAGNWANAR